MTAKSRTGKLQTTPRKPNGSALKAAQAIRQRIFTGRYKADELLSENRLFDELLFSRAAIRRAFTMLEMEQLVQIVPKVGTRVRGVSWNEVMQILGIRLVLESHVAWRLAQTPDANLDEPMRINEKMRRIAEEAGANPTPAQQDRFVELDVPFHTALCTACGYSMIAELLSLMKNRIRQLALPTIGGSEMPVVVDEHASILASIRPKDGAPPDEATVRESVRYHLANASRRWRVDPLIVRDLPELFTQVVK